MKKIILSSLIITSIIAGETQSALETFLLKIGITSLVKDFESEKQTIHENKKDIDMLKSDMRYLMQQNLKAKLKIKDDKNSLVVDSPNTNYISKLKQENKDLKRYIKQLKNSTLEQTITSKTNKNIILEPVDFNATKFRIMVKESTLRASPSFESKIVKYVYKDEVIYIQSCDKYGWCKIYKKEQYIPKYKLSPIL